jgi:hypothetical protein
MLHRASELLTADPLVPEPNYEKVEIATGSPGTDQILANLSKPGIVFYILRSTYFLIIF